MNIISDLNPNAVQPIQPSHDKDYGTGFDQYLQAKMQLKNGRNESQYYYDNSDKKIKYMILSFANRNYPELFKLDTETKTFSPEDANLKFADFGETQRKVIITALNDLKNWTRNLPRYFSPFDCEDRRIRKK